MSNNIEEIITALSSRQKLERDRALSNLIADIPKFETSFIDCLYFSFTSIVKRTDIAWEVYHGILQALKVLLDHQNSPFSDIQLLKEIRDSSINLLSHYEVRVCLASGEVLGALCLLDDCITFQQCRPLILHLIQKYLDKNSTDVEFGGNISEVNEEKLNSDLRERRYSGDTTQLFHDAAKWHRLETCMKCLEFMIIGGGSNFLPFIDKELLELIFTTQNHSNRFVRETGLSVLAALVSCVSAEDNCHGQGNFLLVYGDQISTHIALGLADNWSQVRFTASLACRKFLMALPVSAREMFFQLLLPRICLNRYYVAEGVKLYSQETWSLVTAMEGRQLVEKYIDYVVPYYIEATKADNHSVREAACACIGELPVKINAAAVCPHIHNLLKALIICLSDELWKVRDVACLASGNFISCAPQESYGELEFLLPLLFNNLKDNIPSLRQEAATAIKNVVTSYDHEIFKKIQEIIIGTLKGVESQSSEVEICGQGDMNINPCGVGKAEVGSYMDTSTALLGIPCGSVLPMMGRSVCNACLYKKPQPWQMADGCIYLIGTLSSVSTICQDIAKLLPILAESCGHKHYDSHVSILETLCLTLPTICKGIGKRPFKERIYLFFDLIFYSLECKNTMTSSAAVYCLSQLSEFLGPNILRGRIEEFNPLYLKAFDANACPNAAP